MVTRISATTVEISEEFERATTEQQARKVSMCVSGPVLRFARSQAYTNVFVKAPKSVVQKPRRVYPDVLPGSLVELSLPASFSQFLVHVIFAKNSLQVGRKAISHRTNGMRKV